MSFCHTAEMIGDLHTNFTIIEVMLVVETLSSLLSAHFSVVVETKAGF